MHMDMCMAMFMDMCVDMCVDTCATNTFTEALAEAAAAFGFGFGGLTSCFACVHASARARAQRCGACTHGDGFLELCLL